MSIKAQPNKTLVGVVATFPHGCGESKDEGLRVSLFWIFWLVDDED